jgi:hypothetical protein
MVNAGSIIPNTAVVYAEDRINPGLKASKVVRFFQGDKSPCSLQSDSLQMKHKSLISIPYSLFPVP